MASLLPATIITSKGDSVPSSSLAGKVIGLYFSAHWCPPCRGFTPRLVEWFANFKAKHAQKDKLELVFVSSDRDQTSFNEYHHEMNFHAVPYADREAKAQLSSKFGVSGIPTLVFVDADGNTISKAGRSIVMEDEQAAQFPWTPKPLSEILGDSFMDNKGNKSTLADLAGKYLGLYFSAHWCPPCRGFTPKLVDLYNKIKADGKPFEIVFVSSDRDKASFDEYFAEMPWLSLDVDAPKRKEALSKYFEVEGIPTFVVLDPELKTITTEGRAAAAADPEGADFPWLPKALNPLTDAASDVVNDFPFLLASTDGSDEEIKAAVESLTPSAEAEFAKADPKLKFFYVKDPDEELLDPIRRFAKLTEDDRLVILDVQHNKKYLASDQTHSVANVTSFVQAFLNGTLPSTPARS